MEFALFPHHGKDENLASISYACEGVAKVWYLVNPSDRCSFERAVANYILSPEYLKDHDRCKRQVIAMKSTIFEPKYLLNLKCLVKESQVIQPKWHFVILAPMLTMEDPIVDKTLRSH